MLNVVVLCLASNNILVMQKGNSHDFLPLVIALV